jgi:hypothetical protein
MSWKKYAKAIDQYCQANKEMPKAIHQLEEYFEEEEVSIKSISAIEKEIWVKLWEDIKSLLNKDEDFDDYPAQQKWIAAQYVFVNLLGEYPNYLKVRLKSSSYLIEKLSFTSHLKSSNSSLISNIISVGNREGTIQERWLLNSLYPNLFLEHIVAIAYYFGQDSSEDKQDTDAFIDKSTNLFFEFLGKNILERGFDLGKFLYQSLSMTDGSKKNN